MPQADAKGAGAAVWLVALWLFAATDPVYPLLIRGPSEWVTDFSDVNRARRLVWAGLYAAALAAAIYWRREGLRAALSHGALPFALAWFALSCLWSPEPIPSVLGLAQYLLALAAGAAAGGRLGPLGAAQAVSRMAALALAASAAMAIVSPPHAFGQHVNVGALRGVYVEKNHLAMILSYGAAAAVFEALARRGRAELWALAGMLALGALAARSSIAVLQLALAGGLALAWAGLGRARYGAAAAGAAAAAGLLLLAAALPAALTALGEDLTLNGRTTLWTALWPRALEAPWLGHGFFGYRAAEDVEHLRALLGWNARGTHSGWLTALLYGGAPGLVLWLVVWAGAARRALAAVAPGGDAGAAALGALVLAHLAWSLFESNQLMQMNLHAALSGLCLSLAASARSRPALPVGPPPWRTPRPV